MVLRGQPVGEQGAADRWTALDPYIAGSGAGAPRGIPSRGAPFLFLHMRPQGPAGFKSRHLAAQFSPYRSAEGPPGPFSMGRGSAIKDRILKLPICGLDDPAISIPKGPAGPFFMVRLPSP